MDLFLQSNLSFEKLAMGTEMPEDPNQWAQAILQEVYKQLPYLSDFSPHVNMEKIDAEQGYGFGSITVSNQTEVQPGAAAAGVRQVRIPVVIKGGKLSPLDLMVTDDSKVFPMTESRLRSAIFRPQAFDVTSKTPGDQSMIGTLFPPYRNGVGMGMGGFGGVALEGAGMGKMASMLGAISGTLNDSDLAAFKSTLLEDSVRLAYEKNAAATFDATRALLEQPERRKVAFSELVEPSVMQVVKIAGGYVVKTASHKYWDPQTRILNRGEALEELGEKIVMAADMSGAATIASDATATGIEAPEEHAGPISSCGVYSVHTDDGQALQGYVIPNLYDTDGTRLPISLFTNGQQAAVQSDILGTHVSNDVPELPSASPSGYGVFYTHEDGGLVATIPMELTGSFAQPGEPSVSQGVTFDGRQVEVSQQPNLQTIFGTPERLLVPMHWKWLPMDKAGEVSLRSSEDGAPKEASARRAFASVDVVSGGSQFSIRGPVVEKIAHDQREFLDVDDAMFLLAGLGVEQAYGMRKLAESTMGHGAVNVQIGRLIHTAAEQTKVAHAKASEFLNSLPSLKRQLFKEAAVISDPEAVDTVLSLGFINPENLTTFIGYMPVLEGSQSKLCELLMASRLGLNNTPEGALERAVRATEEVLEGLKTLAFESPSGVN